MTPNWKQPGWLRGLEIVTGVVALFLAVVVLAYPGFAVATLIVFVSFGLVFLGVRSLSIAGHMRLPGGHRALSAISGLLSFVLAALVLAIPGFALLTLLWLLSFGLLFYGVWMMTTAYVRKSTHGGVRFLRIAVGILDVVLSVGVFALPGLALLSLVALLGAALLFSGAEMILSGLMGRTWLEEAIRKEMSPAPQQTTM